MLSHLTIHHIYQAIKWDVEGIKGGYNQQQPELQQTTLHADPPSVRPRLPRPTCMIWEESKSYFRIQAIDKYRLFFKDEYKYFKSEYHSVKKLSKSDFDDAHLAIKKSSNWPAAMCRRTTRQVPKFLRSPALSTGQAIGVSLLSLARCGGLWDYPRALKAGLLHPTATNPDQLGSPSRCILCHSHLDCRPMAHLVVDCTHPTVFFARVDTQLLQTINDTRVQIFDCTLHTTTTTTTPASPSLSTTSSNSNPNSTGTLTI
ncbi:hypothetical protein BASA61_005732 [Batrachochytrium salamandrivorans]|nr:hypothetical protein BASA61_005732 [Batrachochytrium salamandrivorans]